VIPKIAEEIEARKKLKELRESKESFDRRNPAHKHVTKKARTTFSGPSSIEPSIKKIIRLAKKQLDHQTKVGISN
jgi:hypothetical protein